MCQWGHHPETCQRHSPAPQGARTLHLAPMCAYFTVCILDHPEEESASSQCLSMAGSPASLGHSSRQLSGTKIFFFFFFPVWLQIPYTLSNCQPFLHKGCFWKQIPQTCLFWAPPLQLWSTHSVAKTQRAVVFSVPFLSGSMLGICGYNWSQLESFHPCHKLAEHQKGTHYSRLLCYPTGEQTQSVSRWVFLRMFGVWWWYVKAHPDWCLQNSKLAIELQIMVAKMDKKFWREGKRSTIWMMEDFALTKKVPCRVILPTNHKSATRNLSTWFSIWRVFRLTGDLAAIEVSFL